VLTAQWSVQNGELVGISENLCTLRNSSLVIGDNTWKNYVFESQIKITQTLHAGCTQSVVSIGIHADDTDGFNMIALTVWKGLEGGVAWRNVGCANESRGNPDAIGGTGGYTNLAHIGGLADILHIELDTWYTMRITAISVKNSVPE